MKHTVRGSRQWGGLNRYGVVQPIMQIVKVTRDISRRCQNRWNATTASQDAKNWVYVILGWYKTNVGNSEKLTRQRSPSSTLWPFKHGHHVYWFSRLERSVGWALLRWLAPNMANSAMKQAVHWYLSFTDTCLKTLLIGEGDVGQLMVGWLTTV